MPLRDREEKWKKTIARLMRILEVVRMTEAELEKRKGHLEVFDGREQCHSVFQAGIGE